jgi:hypothetical protein
VKFRGRACEGAAFLVPLAAQNSSGWFCREFPHRAFLPLDMTSDSTRLIDKRLEQVDDPQFRSFTRELELTTGAIAYGKLSVLKFLQSCLYRNGLGEPVLISSKEINNPFGELTRTVGEFKGQLIHQMCDELAWHLRSERAELWEDTKLRMFLNKVLTIRTTPKKISRRVKGRARSEGSINNWGWIPTN